MYENGEVADDELKKFNSLNFLFILTYRIRIVIRFVEMSRELAI